MRDVFELRERLITDYSSYTRSFIRIRDERIEELVFTCIDEGRLWPDPLMQWGNGCVDCFQGAEPAEIDEEITALQNALDSLSIDAKLESLLAYLRSVPLRNLRTVIECRFAATARYLTSALADLDTSVVSATADLRPSDTLKILTAFENRGGILVATIPTLQGVEFAADLIVAYDSVGPWMRSAFRPRIRPLEDDGALRVVYLNRCLIERRTK